jgi:hypothetical protein
MRSVAKPQFAELDRSHQDRNRHPLLLILKRAKRRNTDHHRIARLRLEPVDEIAVSKGGHGDNIAPKALAHENAGPRTCEVATNVGGPRHNHSSLSKRSPRRARRDIRTAIAVNAAEDM